MATGSVYSGVVSYLGELFLTARRPNTTLKLLGGMQNMSIQKTSAKEFPIGVFYDLRAPSQPANLEGANAPAAQYRTLTQATNVIQIFQEGVNMTYLAASDNTVSGVVPIPQAKQQGEVINPRSEEWQVMRALETVAQDANYSFLNGAYANPADPTSTALKTRGILTAIATNYIDKSADVAPTVAQYKAYVELATKTLTATTGYNPDDTWVIQAGADQFNNIQAAYEGKTTPPYDREVAGLKLRQIYTRFGILNLALDPDMPADKFAILNYGVMGIVGLEVPNKGYLFEEPLAKTGSTDKTQIYGQLGVDHGPEFMHALLKVPTGLLY